MDRAPRTRTPVAARTSVQRDLHGRRETDYTRQHKVFELRRAACGVVERADGGKRVIRRRRRRRMSPRRRPMMIFPLPRRRPRLHWMPHIRRIRTIQLRLVHIRTRMRRMMRVPYPNRRVPSRIPRNVRRGRRNTTRFCGRGGRGADSAEHVRQLVRRGLAVLLVWR